MTDERMERLLGGWMQSSVPAEPDARVSAAAVLERLDEAPPVRKRSRITTVLQAAASLAIVAIIGGLALFASGQPAPLTGDARPLIVAASPGAEQTPAQREPDGPPIHWESDEVDLRADGLTLRIGEDTYVGRDADFWLEAGSGGERSWWISAAWDEGGDQHLLSFDFGADTDDWWIESVRHERPDVYGPDGTRHSGVTWLYGDAQRYPLGRTATGDLRFGAITLAPTCEQLVSTELDVTLELDGLRLAVEPGGASPLEEFADALLGPRSRIGRILDPPPEPQTRFVELECPAPETVLTRFGDLELEAEPVGAGALRVLGDGVHDLDRTIVDVAVDPDGAVVVATLDDIRWLGSTRPPVATGEHVPWPTRVALAPDGSILVVGGDRQFRKDAIASFDGDELTRLPSYVRSDRRGEFSEDIHDPVWDAEGTLWAGASGGIGALVDGAWVDRSRSDYAPIAASSRALSYGPTRSLAVDPDGGVWVATASTFSHYQDGRWIEHDPLAEAVDALAGPARAIPLDLKIDAGGTMWALTNAYAGGRTVSATVLVRRIGEDWSVFLLESIAPGEGLESQHIAAHDGAVFLLVVERSEDRRAAPSEPRLLRFDGTTTEELARLPAGLGYRIADVGPDGTVWIVGGSAERRHADRIHIVAPTAVVSPE